MPIANAWTASLGRRPDGRRVSCEQTAAAHPDRDALVFPALGPPLVVDASSTGGSSGSPGR